MSEVTKYTIPSSNIPRLRSELEKLNRRAAKLGCDELALEVHGTTRCVHPNYALDVAEGFAHAEDVPKYDATIVSIIGTGPKLAGWTFLGTLDHNTLPGSVIVKTVPGQTVPEGFYHSEAFCDHCDKIRRRTETFVVQHENGEYKQVGRNCIRDFLGHDPSRIIRLLTSFFKFVGKMEEFYGGSGGYADWMYDHKRVLMVTAAIIRTEGWVAKSRAMNEGIPSTAGQVERFFHPPLHSHSERHEWETWRDSIRWDEEEDDAIAEGAMSWLTEQKPNNEYMHNLHAIAGAESVPMRMFGFWCSLVAAYQRAQDQLRQRERENATKLNEWIGEIKERREFEVEVTGIKHIDGYFGVVDLHRMLDSDGRTLTWFANADSRMKVGHKYRIKGTVKKHDEYQNWKQTVLNRVAVIEELE